jgi:hypothetical protein
MGFSLENMFISLNEILNSDKTPSYIIGELRAEIKWQKDYELSCRTSPPAKGDQSE